MAFPFRLYGHRGAAAHEPENTLRSFRAALRAGADAIETDVRLSADGEVVVFHDANGARTCGQRELLRRSPWASICQWDAGYGERPIRLEDLLEAFPGVFVNVDVKDLSPKAAIRTLEAVRRAGAEDRVGLGSFHVHVAQILRRAGWEGQLSLTIAEVAALRLLPEIAARWMVRGDAVQIPVRGSGFRLDRPSFVHRCHRLGLRVDYWTIDDPVLARSLVEAGADGIVTNDPAAIVPVLPGRRAR